MNASEPASPAETEPCLAPLLSARGEMVCVWVRECRGLPAIKNIRICLSLEREVKELHLPFESSSQIVQHQTTMSNKINVWLPLIKVQ